MLLNPKQVAEILNCKPASVYSWASKGVLTAYKIEGLLRFKKEEVEAFIEKCKITIEPMRTPSTKTIRDKDIDHIIKNAIETTLKSGYNS